MLIACAPCDELSRLEENAPGPELILVRPDNSWDLVAGTTRVTPGGLVVPGSLMGRGFDNTSARNIASITRSAATYYISVVVAARGDQQLRGEVWRSDDLQSWSTVSLPAEITSLDATLVSALGNSTETLLVLKRQPDADSAQQTGSSSPEIPGLLRDVEFWLLPAGA